ncbi:MAG: hypothetical protein JOZ69_17005 [Myxococcales bacterium]|nr:hypothetical protein [Myxococcales bacterium]
MNAKPSHPALQELRTKYVDILSMRLEHDAGTEDVSTLRVRLAQLASRFPGALREMDELELVEIRERIAALDAALLGTGCVERWMTAVARFHVLARGALCAKRWLRGRKVVDASVRRAYAAALPSLAFPHEAGAWTPELDRVASPPGGRISRLVFGRVAAELGTSEREARRLVFGAPRRAVH